MVTSNFEKFVIPSGRSPVLIRRNTMFVLFAIFLSNVGAVSVATAEFTSYDNCQAAVTALQASAPAANKSFVCTAK